MLRIKRENMQREVWPASLLREPLKLLMHHQVVADPALQNRLIDNDCELKLWFAVKHLLASHADLDQPLDHARRIRLDPAVTANYVPGIRFCLQKTRYNIDVPYVDRACLMLKANELLIIVGKDICELFPPPLLSRILGEREKQRAAGSGDLVVVEQPLDFPWLQASPGPLVPADLGRRPSQRRGDGISALALAFPDRTQLRGEATAAHRGACWHGHLTSLPGTARAGPIVTITKIFIEVIVKLPLHLTT